MRILSWSSGGEEDVGELMVLLAFPALDEACLLIDILKGERYANAAQLNAAACFVSTGDPGISVGVIYFGHYLL